MNADHDFYKVLLGPKLGDLLHMLIVPKFLYECDDQRKSKLYIVEQPHDVFGSSNTLEQVYEKLYPIIMAQPFAESFEIYNPEIHTIDFDLNNFRYGKTWGSVPYWYMFLFEVFQDPRINIPRNYTILDIEPDEKYKDYLVVSRRPDEYNEFIYDQYDHIISQFDKKIFLTHGMHNYNNFFLKDKIDFVCVETILEQMKIIKGCKLFLGNSTGTMPMASVLNVNRVFELTEISEFLYLKEDGFYDNAEIIHMNGYCTPHGKYMKK